MRVVGHVMVLSAMVSIAGACDPAYFVGARLRVAPIASDSCYLNAMRRSFGRGAFEAIDPSQSSLHLTLPDSAGPLAGNANPSSLSAARFRICRRADDVLARHRAHPVPV